MDGWTKVAEHRSSILTNSIRSIDRPGMGIECSPHKAQTKGPKVRKRLRRNLNGFEMASAVFVVVAAHAMRAHMRLG
jgi:hypothetical protein